jgi:hypothetical protein
MTMALYIAGGWLYIAAGHGHAPAQIAGKQPANKTLAMCR